MALMPAFMPLLTTVRMTMRRIIVTMLLTFITASLVFQCTRGSSYNMKSRRFQGLQPKSLTSILEELALTFGGLLVRIAVALAHLRHGAGSGTVFQQAGGAQFLEA